MKSVIALQLLLVIAIASASCVPANGSRIPTPTAIVSASSTFMPPVPTFPLSPTKTATLTPVVSLEPDQAAKAIRSFLQESADCESPCFLGITSGRSTFGEAENTLNHLGLQSIYTNSEDSKEFYESRYDLASGLSFSLLLTIQKGIVSNVNVFIRPELLETGMPREWLAYSPETLISRYGAPSKVSFLLDWGPRSFFDMVIYFDSVDLIVEYSGYDIIPRQKGSPQVCPLTDQYDSVWLWLGKNPVDPPANGVTLETATSLTIDEYTQLLTGELDMPCFKINGEAFP